MSLKLSFWVRPSQQSTRNRIPVYLRIQVSSNRVEYSTGITVLPSEWDKKRQVVKGRSELTESLNGKISALKARAIKVYNELVLSGEPFSASDIKDRLVNGKTSAMTFDDVMEEYIEKMKSLKGISYAQPTIIKYRSTQLRVSEYVKSRYKRKASWPTLRYAPLRPRSFEQ